jgi:uncharacterized damage-inducible protein DinB
MDVSWAIQQLTAQSTSIAQLCAALSEEDARVKPDPQSWSIVEVINHLYDEEREDFRQRLDLTLHQPEADWPPIDPDGWVTSRAYQQRDLQQSLDNFAAERQRSIAWLQALRDPDWDRAHTHLSGFVLSAGDLLSAWVAHDLLHLRQLIELRYHLATGHAQPYAVEYAGDW